MNGGAPTSELRSSPTTVLSVTRRLDGTTEYCVKHPRGRGQHTPRHQVNTHASKRQLHTERRTVELMSELRWRRQNDVSLHVRNLERSTAHADDDHPATSTHTNAAAASRPYAILAMTGVVRVNRHANTIWGVVCTHQRRAATALSQGTPVRVSVLSACPLFPQKPATAKLRFASAHLRVGGV